MLESTRVQYSIPCLDLMKQQSQVKEEIFSVLEDVYDLSAFSDGPFVKELEERFASFCEARFATGVNNGTSALHLALLALNIGAGDEVIVPANTFIATAWAVSYTGAKPIFADCTSNTWQISPDAVKTLITPRTKAVIGVHLYGQPCEIDSLKEICEENGIYFMEDASQAHGALYKGKKVGSFGELATFSFYPGKNLGACGEAGAILTNSPDYDKRLKKLRNHGSSQRYYHEELGFNMRMSGFEAASLLVKLAYLEGWNQKRKAIAKRYQEEILNPEFFMQQQPDNCDSVYHLFVITTANRKDLISYLNINGVYPGLHYPLPCHLQKAYAHLGNKRGSCPNAEHLAEHCLSLPMFAELEEDQVSHIINLLNSYQS